MRKTLAHALVFILTTWLTSIPFLDEGPRARAQSTGQEQQEEDDLLSAEIVQDTLTEEEEPPPKPEFPYPGALSEEGFGDPAPRTAEAPSPPPPPSTLPRPQKIDDDENYYYGTDVETPVPSGRPGIEPPIRTNPEGEYFYREPAEKAEPSHRAGTEKPIQTNQQGEYFYETEKSPRHGSASVRFGVMTPPKLKNPLNGATFSEIYSDSNAPVVLFNYEWLLTSKVGRLGLKLGSGVVAASGNGRFKIPTGRPDPVADERFTFLMFPNQLTAVYHFQYADEQVLVPYAEGGIGYFGVVELRDDDKAPKFGGSLVTVAAGGVNILMDWIDRRSIRQLDLEWGINHVWLTLEFRQIIGLQTNKLDFTSSVVNAGVIVEF